MDKHVVDFEKTLLPNLGITMHVIDLYISETLKDHGYDLTKVQMLLLMRLSRNDGQPQQDLAFLTHRDKTSLTRLLDTMERKNLVARIPSKTDKRINLIYLTKHGWEMINQVRPIMKGIIADVQKEINTSDIKTMIQLLKKIQSNINYSDEVAYQTKVK